MRRISGVIVLLAASVSYAQPADAPPATEATKLFEEGRDLGKAGKWTEACDRFTKAYALDRGVGIELNLADCQEHLGHFTEAWRLFDDAAVQSKAQNNPTREKFARDRATALEKKLATVVLRLPAPDGATVTINGKAVTPSGEVHERVDPGKVDVVVLTRDGKTFKDSKEARSGQVVVIDAGGDTTTTTTTTTTTSEAPPPPPPERGSARKKRVYLSFGIAGAGLVAMGASGLIGLSAKSDYDKVADDRTLCPSAKPLQCTDAGRAKIDDAQSKANIGTGVFFGGVALIAAGTVLYFTAPHEHAEIALSPTVSPDGIGFAAAGHF